MPAPRELAPTPGLRAVELLDAGLELAAAAGPAVQVQIGATVFASMILGRSRMPALLAIATAVGFGYGAKRAYMLAHDIHLAALEITADAGRIRMAAPGADRAV